MLEVWRFLQKKLGKDNIDEYFEFLEYLKREGEITDNHIAQLVVYAMLEYVTKIFGLYYVSLQIPFKEIIKDGKYVRADIFIHNPRDLSFKLIVECDGYEHHSDRTAFSKDRTRDRLFQMSDFKVFRFSGSDINNYPVEMAKELYDYLVAQNRLRI